MKKLLTLMLTLICGVCLAGETARFTVEARGVGIDADSALNDALAQAIRQAAGAIVDSQTLMKNDEIVQEKILTASNAVVKKYEIVEPAKRNRSGLFEVKIRAEVEQNLLRQKMIEHKVISGTVEGAQDMWAEIVTQKKNQNDMIAMLESTLSNIDPVKYMSFDILGANGKRGSEATLHIDNLGDRVEISFGLICQFDDRRFQQEVMPHLRRVFDELPFESRHEVTIQGDVIKVPFKFPERAKAGRRSYPRAKVAKGARYSSDPDALLEYRVMHIGSLTHSGHINRHCRVREQGGGGGTIGVMLDTSPKFRPNLQKFVCYHFPTEMPYGSINRWRRLICDLGNAHKGISVSLCLFDADGEEIHRITRKIAESDRSWDRGYVEDSAFARVCGNGFLVIFPGLLDRTFMSPLCILPVRGTMSLEDFKDVKSFKLKVDLGPAAK